MINLKLRELNSFPQICGNSEEVKEATCNRGAHLGRNDMSPGNGLRFSLDYPPAHRQIFFKGENDEMTIYLIRFMRKGTRSDETGLIGKMGGEA